MTENKVRILIADDSAESTCILYDYLDSQYDFEVIGTARNGIEACEQISLKQPDIVILDIIMPGLSGIGVLEKINSMSLSKKPSFIVLSAVGQDKIIQNVLALGARYYILKPFDMKVLVSKIRQLKDYN